jgi:pyrrolidone-carboxylate peptidase
MLDTVDETQPDRRPAILVCVYESEDPSWAALEDMADDGWHPHSARALPIGPGDPDVLAGLLTGELEDPDCRGVLLVGRTRRTDGFRIQMRAENRTLTGGARLVRTGPALARATAPVAEMVRALTDAGLAADASSESEEDAGSYLLYRILTALPDSVDAPAVGLLRVPAATDPQDLRTGIRTAAGAIARHLSPLPRIRLS